MKHSNMDSRLLYETISNIEIEIKVVIKEDILKGVFRKDTFFKIKKIVSKYCKDLPDSFKKEIIQSTYQSAIRFYEEYEKETNQWYAIALSTVLALGFKSIGQLKLNNKKDLYHYIVEHPEHAFDKYPFLKDYKRNIQKRTLELAQKPMLSIEPNKKAMSLFAKAELQIRYEQQQSMIENLRNKNQKLCWISSHVDCSERCRKWQGKLVDLDAPAINSSFETGKIIDGHKVYSFNAITSQKDKYGYFNNIIVGFNCRHRLIPYKEKSKPPHSYRSKIVKKEFTINEQLRTMERTIRDNRKKALLIKDISSKKYKELNKSIKGQLEAYKSFANENHVTPLIWRTQISKGEKFNLKQKQI